MSCRGHRADHALARGHGLLRDRSSSPEEDATYANGRQRACPEVPVVLVQADDVAGKRRVVREPLENQPAVRGAGLGF